MPGCVLPILADVSNPLAILRSPCLPYTGVQTEDAMYSSAGYLAPNVGSGRETEDDEEYSDCASFLEEDDDSETEDELGHISRLDSFALFKEAIADKGRRMADLLTIIRDVDNEESSEQDDRERSSSNPRVLQPGPHLQTPLLAERCNSKPQTLAGDQLQEDCFHRKSGIWTVGAYRGPNGTSCLAMPASAHTPWECSLPIDIQANANGQSLKSFLEGRGNPDPLLQASDPNMGDVVTNNQRPATDWQHASRSSKTSTKEPHELHSLRDGGSHSSPELDFNEDYCPLRQHPDHHEHQHSGAACLLECETRSPTRESSQPSPLTLPTHALSEGMVRLEPKGMAMSPEADVVIDTGPPRGAGLSVVQLLAQQWSTVNAYEADRQRQAQELQDLKEQEARRRWAAGVFTSPHTHTHTHTQGMIRL
jgi:hypothetical protein